MRIRSLILVLSLLMLTVGCRKEIVEIDLESGVKAIRASIASPMHETKAIGGGTVQDEEIDINMLTIRYAGKFDETFQDLVGNPTVTLATSKEYVDVVFTKIEGETRAEFMDRVNKFTLLKVLDITSAQVYVNVEAPTTLNLSSLEVTTEAQTLAGRAPKCYGIGRATVATGKMTGTDPIYNCPVTVYIPVARIEAKGVQITDLGTIYTSMKYAGIYLNNYYPNGNIINKTHLGEMLTIVNNENANLIPSIKSQIKLHDLLETPTNVAGQTFPAAGQYYSYNFYTAPSPNSVQLPNLTVLFTDCHRASGVVDAVRYAEVKKYMVDGTAITSMEPGKVYKIESLALMEGNIESSLMEVIATVTVENWTVVNTTVSW